MALPARIKSEEHAKLNDALKAEYTKDEASGMLVLNVVEVDGWTLDNPAELRKAIKAERKRADDAEAQLSPYKADGKLIDPVKARDALKQVEAGNTDDPDEKSKRKIDSITRQLTDKHAAEIEPLKRMTAEFEREIERLTVDSRITGELSKLTLIPGGQDGLLAIVKAKNLVRAVKNKDGRFEPKVYGDDGIERVTNIAGKSGAMDVTELMAIELRKAYPGFYITTDKSGGGAHDGSTKRGTQSTTENLSPTAKLTHALAAAS